MAIRQSRDTTLDQPDRSSRNSSSSKRSSSVESSTTHNNRGAAPASTVNSAGRRSSDTSDHPRSSSASASALQSVLVPRRSALDTQLDSSPRVNGLQSPHPTPAVTQLLLGAPHCSSSSSAAADSAEPVDPSRSLLHTAPLVAPHPEECSESADSPSVPSPRQSWLRRLCGRCATACACPTESERAMCGIICCFGCLTCLGCRDKVCQRLVFFPPQPFYAIEERHGAQTMWLVEEGQRIEPYSSPNMRLAFVHTRKQSTIATLWLRYPGATTTVLFSHGNATDLGCMRNHLVDFARQLQVNVLAYDYTGYGLSAGPGPTMAHTLADVEAAYDYLLRTYPNESARIIVYGQSIGSGPTLHLARNRRCNGVVVHSGIMSALRVIQPSQSSTRWFDIFPNVDLVASVPACVFVIHGTADKEIPVEHGQGLAAAAPNSFPAWWVEGAGHNNVEVDFREAYFAQLDQFVRFVEQSTPHVEETDDPRAAAASSSAAAPPAKEQRAGASASAGGKKQPAVRASIEMQTYNKKGLGSSSSSNGSDPRSMQSPKLPPNHQPSAHRQSFDQI